MSVVALVSILLLIGITIITAVVRHLFIAIRVILMGVTSFIGSGVASIVVRLLVIDAGAELTSTPAIVGLVILRGLELFLDRSRLLVWIIIFVDGASTVSLVGILVNLFGLGVSNVIKCFNLLLVF